MDVLRDYSCALAAGLYRPRRSKRNLGGLRRTFHHSVLENGLLPASFLPGDSLLLLSGALIAKGVMGFAPTLLILTAAAGLGCWLSYIGAAGWATPAGEGLAAAAAGAISPARA